MEQTAPTEGRLALPRLLAAGKMLAAGVPLNGLSDYSASTGLCEHVRTASSSEMGEIKDVLGRLLGHAHMGSQDP